MFGIKIVSEKEYDGLKTEIKGYYDGINETNQYLRAIEAHMKGRKLAPIQPMDRMAIRDAYATSAAVMVWSTTLPRMWERLPVTLS